MAFIDNISPARFTVLRISVRLVVTLFLVGWAVQARQARDGYLAARAYDRDREATERRWRHPGVEKPFRREEGGPVFNTSPPAPRKPEAENPTGNFTLETGRGQSPAPPAGPEPPQKPESGFTLERAERLPDRLLQSQRVIYAGATIVDPGSVRDRQFQQEIRDLRRNSQKVLECRYGPWKSVRGDPFYFFWYVSAPPGIRSMLESSQQHPLRLLGYRAVDLCPPRESDAIGHRLAVMRPPPVNPRVERRGEEPPQKPESRFTLERTEPPPEPGAKPWEGFRLETREEAEKADRELREKLRLERLQR